MLLKKTVRKIFHTTKTILTKRAKRQAKKLFKKPKQLPAGWYSLYKMHSAIGIHPELPMHVQESLMRVNDHAKKMFKRPYFSLTSQQQTKVFEDLNTGEKSTTREMVH